METHRKRIRHFHEPGDFHELTFSCYRRLPLLTNDLWRQLLCHTVDRAVSSHDFALVAFVIMPEHMHLLVYPSEPAAKTLAAQSRRQWHPTPRRQSNTPIVNDLSRLLADIKRPFSGRIKKLLLKNHDPLLARLTVMERPGKRVFRFWQEGPGYDRNLSSEASILPAIDYIQSGASRLGCSGRRLEMVECSLVRL
jgi:putative transposase